MDSLTEGPGLCAQEETSGRPAAFRVVGEDVARIRAENLALRAMAYDAACHLARSTALLSQELEHHCSTAQTLLAGSRETLQNAEMLPNRDAKTRKSIPRNHIHSEIAENPPLSETTGI